jgi:acyl-CoA thioesterase
MNPDILKIRNKIEEDKFSKLMNIKLIELKKGYSKLSMIIKEDMINFHGVTHGGAIFTLADAAFAAAANSHGRPALALGMNINYCIPSKKDMQLIAEGFEESLGYKTGLYRIEVKSEEGQLIATAQGIVYRKEGTIS